MDLRWTPIPHGQKWPKRYWTRYRFSGRDIIHNFFLSHSITMHTSPHSDCVNYLVAINLKESVVYRCIHIKMSCKMFLIIVFFAFFTVFYYNWVSRFTILNNDYFGWVIEREAVKAQGSERVLCLLNVNIKVFIGHEVHKNTN